MINKDCCCYDSGMDDCGCGWEICIFAEDLEPFCDTCKHTDLEKALKARVESLLTDKQEERCDYNRLCALERENKELVKEMDELREDLRKANALINKREHNVADFAINNSRYVNDNRR